MKYLRIVVVMFCISLSVIGVSGAAHAAGNQTYQWHASWYGPGFQGRTMANGNTFNMHDPTVVAHKTLPFGTRLRLTNPNNDRSIIVIVQDRGPYIRGRELDLSRAAAQQLGFINAGTARLLVERL